MKIQNYQPPLNGLNMTYQLAVGTVPAKAAEPALVLLAEPRMYHGYFKGYRQPVALLKLGIKTLDDLQLEHLRSALNAYFLKYPLKTVIQSVDEVIESFGEGLCAWQKAGGIPVFEAAQVTRIDNEYTICVPMLFGGLLHQVMGLLLNLFNQHLSPGPFVPDEKLSAQIEALITMLKTHAPQGTNTLNFLKAASAEQIPWMHVALNAFQFGYGQHSRWLDSTFTDNTPNISATLVGSKRTANMLLHKTGFPIAEQCVVQSEAEAIAQAHRMGYPVVIKPIDQSGGKGVYANLVSEQGVKKAFQLAKKFTQTVLMEKHVVGKDYRMLVVNGKMVWAIERIPGGVTGDGLSTIQTLVEQHNQRHRSMFPLRYVAITEDSIDYLSEQGVGLATVLAKGRFVPLNRIANISAGGTPVGVFDKVHPDNQQLVEAAAKLLRLDLAGVDFISPDIQRSYRENDGKIIEVNVQPQIGSTTAPHMYKQILSIFIKDQGRIPIIVVCAHNDFVLELQRSLLKQYQQVGLAKDQCVMLNGEKLVDTPTLFQAGQHLLLRNDLEAMIYCINSEHDIEFQGLPFDRCDSLFLSDARFTNCDSLVKACRGDIVSVVSNKALRTNEDHVPPELREQSDLLITLWNTMSLAASA